MDNTAYEIPRIVVAGRFSTDEEEERLHVAMREPVVWFLCIAVAVLVGTFALQALSLASQGDWYVPSFVFPLVAACVWFLIAWTLRVRRRRIQARQNRHADHWYDEKCIRAGCMICFYSDHVAYSTMRGSSILPYAEITRCCETMDGVVLQSQNGKIFLRAADLTAREIEQVREHIRQHIRPAVYRVKAMAEGRLAEPLPHVRFANFDTVITRAVGEPMQRRWKIRELFGLVIPQVLIYSLTPGLRLYLTPWQLLDCLLCAAVFVAVGMVLTLLTVRMLQPRNEIVRVAITRDGVACQHNGFLEFTVNGRFRLEERADGIVIYFTSGEAVFVPFSTVEEPQSLNEYLANRV
ncbi:MAG: hypothetical protein IJP14_00330 [Clostridia bacterium]|nr:hypothetical protein [Clostridia bacterium]